MEEQRLQLQRAGMYVSVEVPAQHDDDRDPDYAPNVSDSEDDVSGEGIGLETVSSPVPTPDTHGKKVKGGIEACPISTFPAKVGGGHMARHLRSQAHMFTEDEVSRVMKQMRHRVKTQTYKTFPCPLKDEVRMSENAAGKPCVCKGTTRLDADDDDDIKEEDPNTRFERIVSAFCDSKESRHTETTPETSRSHRSALKLFLPNISKPALQTLVNIGDKGGRIDSLDRTSPRLLGRTFQAWAHSLDG